MAYIQADENGFKSVTGKNWRLVYNGTQVIEFAEQDFPAATGGDTQLFVVETKAEAEAEIARLGLVLPEHLIK
jgi:hypothetical protein